MDTIVETLREGDIFRWSYRDPTTDDRRWGSYHCCSRIGIVKRGRLCDTYWSFGNDGRAFDPEDLPKLELTFLANLADLDKAEEWKADYYDDADIVDLNHSNATRGNFYLRKGAVRSAAKMLDVARHKMEKCLREAAWQARRAEEMKVVIAKVEAGDTSVHI